MDTKARLVSALHVAALWCMLGQRKCHHYMFRVKHNTTLLKHGSRSHKSLQTQHECAELLTSSAVP